MIYKIKLIHSCSPFWYFKEDSSGYLEMFTDKGYTANLWVKKEVFDNQVLLGNYVVLEVKED